MDVNLVGYIGCDDQAHIRIQYNLNPSPGLDRPDSTEAMISSGPDCVVVVGVVVGANVEFVDVVATMVIVSRQPKWR